MRPAHSERIVERLVRIEPICAISSTSVSELRFGVLRLPAGQRRDHFEVYLDRFIEDHAVIPFDLPAAEWHAAERARLEKLGRTPPFADGQIAAVAAINDLTLVTRNLRDFEAFEGLRVEGW